MLEKVWNTDNGISRRNVGDAAQGELGHPTKDAERDRAVECDLEVQAAAYSSRTVKRKCRNRLPGSVGHIR